MSIAALFSRVARKEGGDYRRIAAMAAIPLLLGAAAPVVTLRPNLPALSQATARAMSPEALADMLLVPGHPRIVEAISRPEGMAPPWPPGSPIALDMLLVATADSRGVRGFCVKQAYEVVLQHGGGTMLQGKVTGFTQYRLKGTTRGCEVPLRQGYFLPGTHYISPSIVPQAEQMRLLGVVRVLARAQAVARHREPDFPITIDDQLGLQMVAYEKIHPRGHAVSVITDPRSALVQLPLDQIESIGRGANSYSFDLFVGGEWQVSLALKSGRIIHMTLLRAIPPPF